MNYRKDEACRQSAPRPEPATDAASRFWSGWASGVRKIYEEVTSPCITLSERRQERCVATSIDGYGDPIARYPLGVGCRCCWAGKGQEQQDSGPCTFRQDKRYHIMLAMNGGA